MWPQRNRALTPPNNMYYFNEKFKIRINPTAQQPEGLDILEDWSLYDLEGDLVDVIKKLQIALIQYSGTKYTKLLMERQEARYEDGPPGFLLCGIRPLTEEELAKHNAECQSIENQQKAYRKAEYERYKKEFGQ